MTLHIPRKQMALIAAILLAAGTAYPAHAQEAPAGRLLYYSAAEMKFKVMDLKTKTATTLPLPATAGHPVLSPNGSVVAYIGHRDRLYIHHIATGSEVLFAEERAGYSSPTFVSDSTIAYLRKTRDGVQLYLSPVDKAVERKWGGRFPTESFPSPEIAYLPGVDKEIPTFVLAGRSRPGGSRLILLSAAEPKTILTSPAEGDILRYPAVSPNGQTVAFSRDIPGGVWAVEVSGEGLRQLDPQGSWPSYSPDGKYIAFLTMKAVTRGLSVRDVRSGQEVGRTSGGFMMAIAIMSADGKRAFPLPDAGGKPLTTHGGRVDWR
jgi:Tol biopolymer transport system component